MRHFLSNFNGLFTIKPFQHAESKASARGVLPTRSVLSRDLSLGAISMLRQFGRKFRSIRLLLLALIASPVLVGTTQLTPEEGDPCYVSPDWFELSVL